MRSTIKSVLYFKLLPLFFIVLITSCGNDEDEPSISYEVSLSSTVSTVSEAGTSFNFIVSLDKSNQSGQDIEVNYGLAGTATSGDDFVVPTGVASIPNGASSAVITVEISDDNEEEETETIIITLSEFGLADNLSLGSSKEITVNISDNDGGNGNTVEHEVSIGTMSNTVSEGDMGTGFRINLDAANATGGDITVNYQISGTSTAGEDFTAPAGFVVIANGEQDAITDVTLIDDDEVEGDETFIVTLLSNGLPSNVSLGQSSSVTITISDNDEAIEDCTSDNTLNFDNIGCANTPTIANEYNESLNNDIRTITANTIPNHTYSLRSGTTLKAFDRTYTVDATPVLAATPTSILSPENRPRYYSGVAINGIPLDPSPAEPFIFENTETGEYNWDWIFEPTNNQTEVNLDCSEAHSGPFGYHYHGDMMGFADIVQAGLGAGTTVPTEPVQIGWGADGFPVVYKYGPDASGTFKELTSSWQLKSGNRSGDGVSAPCGEYNGKYTVDYEYVSGTGDLDECNGISQTITVGGETFNYFYVITDAFPVMSRCISGTPDDSFTK